MSDAVYLGTFANYSTSTGALDWPKLRRKFSQRIVRQILDELQYLSTSQADERTSKLHLGRFLFNAEMDLASQAQQQQVWNYYVQNAQAVYIPSMRYAAGTYPDPPMKIPKAVSALQSGRKEDIELVLRAAIMRLADDEEAFVVSDEDIEKARNFSLKTTVIEDENAVVLSVVPRKR